MRKNIHRKKNRNRHTNNHGERFMLADELEQGFRRDLFRDHLVMLFPGTMPTMMGVGRDVVFHTVKMFSMTGKYPVCQL
jgi:hypothetical protein